MSDQSPSTDAEQNHFHASSSLEMMDFPMDDSVPITPHQSQHEDSVATSTGSVSGLTSASASVSGGLFFADAMLDLDEAHDIAETPEPRKLVMTVTTTAVAPNLPPADMSTMSQTSQSNNQSNKPWIPPKLGPNTNNFMNRIDGGERGLVPQATHRPRPPRHPRDVRWLVAFFLFVPFSLLVSSCLTANPEEGSPVALSKASKRASFYAILLTFAAAMGLARLMYRTMGGGDGDDARHVASQIIVTFAPITLGVHALLTLCIYLNTPNAVSWCIIPLCFLVRDLFAMRQWQTTASTPGGRQAFFQAICNMALDILSRSLRRSSFYRAVVALVCVQLIVVFSWRSALLGALSHGSTFWFIVALVAGKWATGVVGRLLGLVASGGITTWFVQQSLVIDDSERKKELNKDADDQSPEEESNVREEYRSAEASAYQAVVEMDDGIDDDFEDEDGRQGRRGLWSDTSNSNVLSFLKTSVTVSFGSVAQCGLLGGLAQFVWSVVRNVDAITVALSQRFPSTTRSGFRGMQIGQEGIGEGIGIISKMVQRLHGWARSFVRSHTDLGLTQVASCYKSYQRAALDVSMLVDGSGMEPIIHDDITTRMCTNVCTSVCGAIIILMGLVLTRHRTSDGLTDVSILQSSLLTFILCYSLLFTVMEPLRASIKAIYVCFAQHPQSLSNTYPLIFHRLSRISEANLV